MTGLALILTPSIMTVLVTVAAAFGLFLWWLLRRRRQRIRLPTLRIMELENRRLPRLIWTFPPWIAFACFVATALSFAFFSARPARPVLIPTHPDEHRVHIFVDLSPSVASAVKIEDLAARVAKLIDQLRVNNQVTLSGSSFGVQEVLDGQAAERQILAAGFHRGGVHLGEALKTQTPELGDVDRLMLVSDRDQHSWEDLNWSFLQESMEIFRVPAGNEAHKRDVNFFFQTVRGVPSSDNARQEWDVEIAANRPLDQDREGALEVRKGEKVLFESPWRIPKGKERAQLRVGWPENDAAPGADTLEWRLEIADALDADNLYRTHSVGTRPDVLVLSDPGGERFLEDPAHHLEVTLDVLGFQVSRWDRLDNNWKAAAAFPLWIVQGGTGRGLGASCPTVYAQWRRDPRTLPEGVKKPPVVWLSPFDEPANYRELCHCYARLTAEDGNETMPSYCEDVQTRDQWVGVLKSLGARQIGGDVGDFSGAIAWHRKDDKSGAEVLAFTVPLRPRLAAGMTYGDLPRVLRSLLRWQGFLKDSSPDDSWPRPADISALNAEEKASAHDANVPAGESLLVDYDDALLPPLWTDAESAASGAAMLRRDESDPMPWLHILAVVILGATLLEATFKISRKLRQGLKSRASVLILLGGLFAAEQGRAEIVLNLVGYPEPVSSVMRLAREVAGRTSIDLAPTPQNTPALNAKTWEQPWLWVRTPRQLLDEKGRLAPEVADWVKRGGFLVIENANDRTLDKLTAAGFPFLKENEGWKPIPPDHELMRSFHLLDALPVCPGQVWQGFHFDERLAMLAIPYSLLDQVVDQPKPVPCLGSTDPERGTRIFINLLMVALATDYKKDQIHLPEILKRLR